MAAVYSCSQFDWTPVERVAAAAAFAAAAASAATADSADCGTMNWCWIFGRCS